MAYCPQCHPGQTVDAANNIWGWVVPTFGSDCYNWVCGPPYLKNPGGWQIVGTAQAANNASQPLNDIEKMFRVFSKVVHPADVVIVNASTFLAAGVHWVAGGALILGGCVEPTPFEPLTCAAGATIGTAAIGVGTGIGAYGIYFFNNYTVPAIKNWGSND